MLRLSTILPCVICMDAVLRKKRLLQCAFFRKQPGKITLERYDEMNLLPKRRKQREEEKRRRREDFEFRRRYKQLERSREEAEFQEAVRFLKATKDMPFDKAVEYWHSH